MPIGLKYHSITYLDGCIYIIGGQTSTEICTSSCYKYDIRKKKWTSLG